MRAPKSKDERRVGAVRGGSPPRVLARSPPSAASAASAAPGSSKWLPVGRRSSQRPREDANRGSDSARSGEQRRSARSTSSSVPGVVSSRSARSSGKAEGSDASVETSRSSSGWSSLLPQKNQELPRRERSKEAMRQLGELELLCGAACVLVQDVRSAAVEPAMLQTVSAAIHLGLGSFVIGADLSGEASRLPEICGLRRSSKLRFRTIARAVIHGIREARRPLLAIRSSAARTRATGSAKAPPGLADQDNESDKSRPAARHGSQARQGGRMASVTYPDAVQEKLAELSPGARREMLKPPDVTMALEYAYGYNGSVRNNLMLVSESEVCYNIAGICVVFDFAQRSQRFFTCGTAEVSALTYCVRTGLVASGLRLAAEHRPIERSAHVSKVVDKSPLVWIWRAGDCRAVASCVGEYGNVACLAFTDDGTSLVGIVIENGRSVLCVWDVLLAVRSACATTPSPVPSPTNRLAQLGAMSPNMDSCLATGSPSALHVLHPVLRTTTTMKDNVEGLFCRPCTKEFMLQGRTSILFWQTNQARPSSTYAEFKPFVTPEYGRYMITSAAFIPMPLEEGADAGASQGTVAACGTSDGVVLLFKANKAYRQLEAAQPQVAVTFIVAMLDGGFLCGSRDGVLTVFSAFGDPTFKLPLRAPGDIGLPLNAACILRADMMMVGTLEHELLLLDLREAEIRVERQHKVSESELRALCTHPSIGSCITVGDRLGRIHFYDIEEARLLPNWTYNCANSAGRPTCVTALHWSPKGSILGVGLEDGTCMIMSMSDPETSTPGTNPLEMQSCAPVAQDPVNDVRFDPVNGQYLAVGARNVTIFKVLYDINTKTRVLRSAQLVHHVSLRGASATVLRLQYSQDGVHIMACCRDGMILYWDVASGERRHAFHTVQWFGPGHPYTLPFGWPVLGLWRSSEKEHPDHSSTAFIVCSDHEERLLAAGDSSGRLRLFRFPIPLSEDTGYWELFGHCSKVGQVQWTKDGRLLSVGVGKNDCILQWCQKPVCRTQSAGQSPKNVRPTFFHAKPPCFFEPTGFSDLAQHYPLSTIVDSDSPGSPDPGSPNVSGERSELGDSGVQTLDCGADFVILEASPDQDALSEIPNLGDIRADNEVCPTIVHESEDFNGGDSVTIQGLDRVINNGPCESSSDAGEDFIVSDGLEVTFCAEDKDDGTAGHTLCTDMSANGEGAGPNASTIQPPALHNDCQKFEDTAQEKKTEGNTSIAATPLPPKEASLPLVGSNRPVAHERNAPKGMSHRGKTGLPLRQTSKDTPGCANHEDKQGRAHTDVVAEQQHDVRIESPEQREGAIQCSSEKQFPQTVTKDTLKARKLQESFTSESYVDFESTLVDDAAGAETRPEDPSLESQPQKTAQQHGSGATRLTSIKRSGDELWASAGHPLRALAKEGKARALKASPKATASEEEPAANKASPNFTASDLFAVSTFQTLRDPHPLRDPSSPHPLMRSSAASSSSPCPSPVRDRLLSPSTRAGGPSPPTTKRSGDDTDAEARISAMLKAAAQRFSSGSTTPYAVLRGSSPPPGAMVATLASPAPGVDAEVNSLTRLCSAPSLSSHRRSMPPPQSSPPMVLTARPSQSPPRVIQPHVSTARVRQPSPNVVRFTSVPAAMPQVVPSDTRTPVVPPYTPSVPGASYPMPSMSSSSSAPYLSSSDSRQRFFQCGRPQCGDVRAQIRSPSPPATSIVSNVRSPSPPAASILSSAPSLMKRALSPQAEVSRALLPMKSSLSSHALFVPASHSYGSQLYPPSHAPVVQPINGATVVQPVNVLGDRLSLPSSLQIRCRDPSASPPPRLELGRVPLVAGYSVAAAPSSVLASSSDAVTSSACSGRASVPQTRRPGGFGVGDGVVRRISAPEVIQSEGALQGVRVQVGQFDMEGELFAYRPPFWRELSDAIVYGDSGREYVRLPPGWIVIRPSDGPLLWVHANQLLESMPLTGLLLMKWDGATAAPFMNVVRANLCGEAEAWAALGTNEALLRLSPDLPQGKAVLEPQCSQVFRQWLRHAQLAGVSL